MTHHLPREGNPLIPDDGAPVLPARRPTWWTVRTVRAIGFVCVGLAVALSLVSTLVSWRSAEQANARAVEVEKRLTSLEEYVQGRGEFRDREADRLEREIRDGICDLLDQLPPSPLLDVPRTKYGCGPGAPAELAPGPAVAEPSTPRAEPPATAPPTRSATERPRGAATPAPNPAAGTRTPPAEPAPSAPPPVPPAATPPAPAPAAPPPGSPPPRLLDLEPVTDPLCAVLGVCV